ncbi:photosynthetic reaction center subunit H [Salinarimonas soli]|uniref:Photosynthetic reaction center subunit H n=1 Tax=Salinarimonas soli TaxID=1638099 RepID=A0A5B2VEU9_9HYPH|nr:photosynthetic reaction center subunit H [Salinarimonas soli]KAA2238083.1 photosynthetic reaction center subunit H [Salinarimonas soli]
MHQTGAITGYIDVAQVTLYAFWAFFGALVFYLRREDKREGYPLISDRSDNVRVEGFPPMPAPKTFLLRDGRTYQAPPGVIDTRHVAAEPAERFPGAPLHPTGNPLVDGVGPASYAMRDDLPELTAENETRCVPLRVATDFGVDENDPDPRGMQVVGADGVVAGVVRDIWIDRSEPGIRYFEADIPTGEGTRTVLVPINFSRVDGDRRVVRVAALKAAQFAEIPGTKYPDEVSAREDDRITGYFGGGTLYADPQRAEPIL